MIVYCYYILAKSLSNGIMGMIENMNNSDELYWLFYVLNITLFIVIGLIFFTVLVGIIGKALSHLN